LAKGKVKVSSLKRYMFTGRKINTVENCNQGEIMEKWKKGGGAIAAHS